jgi:hypothetical protein
MKNTAEKESAMKALAKRPIKLFEMLLKGGHNIHELKKVGQCSGGLIRKLVWAGVAEIGDDKTIKLVKGIKKSDLPDVDAEPIKIKRAKKQEAREKAGKDRPAKKSSKEDEDDEEDRPVKKGKEKDKKSGKEKAGKK